MYNYLKTYALKINRINDHLSFYMYLPKVIFEVKIKL